MYYSETPTDYLFIRAETNSEFSACHFVIIHITETWKERMQHRLEAIRCVAGDDACKHIAYRASPVGFYVFANADQENTYKNVSDWCFIQTTENELEEMETIGIEMCGHEVLIEPCGDAWHRAYDDQNNDEFYSHDVKLVDIISAVHKPAP